jgi:diaminopimelate decarboxylase
VIRRVDAHPPRNAAELAERFGTPLYVFDGARLAAEAEAFRAAWGPDVTIGYSMKSNPLMGIVSRLHRAGLWAEVASGFEYRAARRAGVPGHEIIFNGPHKPQDDLKQALREGATIVADGPEEVRRIAGLAREASPAARIGIRLSPPGREGVDRFGVTPRHAAAAGSVLAAAG